MIRRYTEPKASRGTVIPPAMRDRVMRRDRGCVGAGRFPVPCAGALELDHVQASHATGMKSVTCVCNLVSLCGSSHLWKTEHGREARPILLDYLATFDYSPHTDGHLDDCGHVDPIFDCDACQRRQPVPI